MKVIVMYILYCIENVVSNSIYIGMTSNSIDRRFYEHTRNALTLNIKSKFYDAIRSYGINKFCVFELDKFDTREECAAAEIDSIQQSKDIGMSVYNIALGGNGGFVVPEDKIDDWKCKLSLSRKGKKPALGMNHTEENKKLFSEVSNKYWDENRKYNIEEIAGYDSFKSANLATGISRTHYYRLIKRALNNEQG